MSISRKALAQNLQISSAFQRDSFHGHLYIEARSEAHVKQAIDGLIGVYVSNTPLLIPIEEMPDLLKSRRKQTPLQVGGWVRIKKGVYKGDLAKIDDVPESTDFVTLKVVPRIEMSPKEDQQDQASSFASAFGAAGGKKRRRPEHSALFRPPAKPFNAEEVRAAYAGRAKVVKDAEGFHFMNELYYEGYLIKDFKMHMIDRDNVNPTIDEISAFVESGNKASGGNETDLVTAAGSNKLDLNSVKDASRAQTVLQPGDFVEIFEGSQKGISGTIDSISNNILYLSPTDPEDLKGTTIEVLVDQVRKKFRSGDHIKVLRGKNVNESGLVLKIKDDLVTFLSDLSMEEITVFSKDIREAAEVGAATASYGQYELHDLIQLE
jgi:transcription elongation factor SPT5